MSEPKVYSPLNEIADPGLLPLGDLVDDVLEHIWIAPMSYDATAQEVVIGLFVDQVISVKIPGISAATLALGSVQGGIDFEIRARSQPTPFIGAKVPLTLRIDAEILRPLKNNSNEPDPSPQTLDIPLGTIEVGFDTDGNLSFDVPTGITIPRCMIGSSGVILEIGSLRWLTPKSDLTSIPTNIRNQIPTGFTGLYLENVDVEITSLPTEAAGLTLEYAFIGTGGFTGAIDWPSVAGPSLRWNGSDFENGPHGELLGFKGGLSKVKLAFKQNALTECDVEGQVFVPYLDKVVGLSLGFDGNGGVTAIAQAADTTAAVPQGYLLTADTEAFKLDISRIEFHAGGDAVTSLALSGRAKLKINAFDLPAIEFQGLRIDSEGHVAVEGGWLDVDTAKSGALGGGFPLQITRIGFGAESNGRRWVGLNGGIKLADGLPVGASVEGLRVSWDPTKPNGDVAFSLEGIGLELSVPGTFSFAGKVAFFSNTEATGFRGTLKLSLDTIKLTIDAGFMVGRTHDGTTFFFFYLDVGLPAGIPLFSTGAALYGFAGLLAVNLRPARAEGENWYWGYYKRPPIGVTDPAKWAIQRDAFAIGLGTTIGTLPDTGFSLSAKVLLILVLPGPQLLLQGKGQFISKKPDEKDPSAEGSFEALLVLDIPGKLFQANLAVAFKISSLIEISASLDAAFSWSPNPPADLWHVYLGEKTPPERRIHATLFKLLQGDSWLMINRGHLWPPRGPGLPDREGDFEIGGSVGVDFKFDFSVAKAWLNASLGGQAAITWDPQQFTASVALKGSAGVSALGASIVADLLAAASVKAPSPWFLTADLEVGLKIDLLFVKWEFHSKLPWEYGDKSHPLPQPVRDHATISSDYEHADEAQTLYPAKVVTVAPDVRPLIVFKRPVQDLARFGAPGRDDIEPDDFEVRQISYRLRHVLLVETGSGGPRLVGAAGELTIAGGTASFEGFNAPGADALPGLAGSELTLIRPGDLTSIGQFAVTGSGRDSATVAGNPPAGTYAYRLSASVPTANVQITTVGTPTAGEITLTIVGPVANPEQYSGGTLAIGTISWLVLEATATTIRIRTSTAVPTAVAATLSGPMPPTIEGKWFPADDPVTEAESSTKLRIWAKTPYAFFRHNEQEAIAGLDAFKPGYACGPVAIEEPICTRFEDVSAGSLTGIFATAGVPGTASGVVTAVPTGTGSDKRLELGTTGAGGGWGTVVFLFDGPVDSIWVTAEAREAGTLTARREGAVVAQYSLEHSRKRFECSGGVDQLEITGLWGTVYEICFVPGWTCIHFEADSFPQGQTGELVYAGVTLASAGQMTVDGDTLEVDPPLPRMTITPSERQGEVVRAAAARPSAEATSLSQPITSGTGGDRPDVTPGALPFDLALPGLVEPVLVPIPMVGDVRLVPGLILTPPLDGGLGRSGIPTLPDNVIAVEPWRDPANLPSRAGAVDHGRVWNQGSKATLVTLTIVFPKPVTRVRVRVAFGADVIAFAGQREVSRGRGGGGSVVSLYADPSAASHIGWLDRVVITGAPQVRVREVCTDSGNFGWNRHEQWKWSESVQRSIESLYSSDPVLSPGNYELRVYTAAVVTGADPGDSIEEEAKAAFIVGAPPGFPVKGSDTALHDADANGRFPGETAQRNGSDTSVPGVYPDGGPLMNLATYVERTLPPAGTRLWYRGYDTAVGFNESYVTRMYLEAGYELRVFVVNASGVELRSSTRHVWGTTDAALDAWTDLYVRTLHGDGTDPCATVAVDKITRPEQVTAGNGEPLEPAGLHASELRTVGAVSRVVHRFEFTTSQYVSFRHHLATFDGRCRRLAQDPGAVAPSVAPRDRADALATKLTALPGLVTAARNAKTAASTGSPSDAVLDTAKAALAALAQARDDVRTQGASDFDEIWRSCLGTQNRPLPPDVRLSVVEAKTTGAGVDVLLLESPEPIAWQRTTLTLAKANTIPQRKITTTFAPDFGRPDRDFEVMYGGIRFLAGVELWEVDGAIRARGDEPLSVTVFPEQASAVELTIRVDPGGSATVRTVPPQPGGDIIRGPSSGPITVALSALPGTLLTSVSLSGVGVGLESCAVTLPFIPIAPTGQFRIVAIALPTATQPLDHEVTVIAMEGGPLDGYTVRWIDAVTPGASQLYAAVGAINLRAGQRLRLIPSRAAGVPSDDALVQAGGAGLTPPTTGAIYQLIDPTGRIVHECAAMPLGAPTDVMAFPNLDGARAILVTPSNAQGFDSGYWVLSAMFTGDIGPDLDRWSIGGVTVSESASLRFAI